MVTLILPTVGVTPDPEWATQLNAAITALNAGKIESFDDPGADRIVFWDDSASAWVALSVTTPLTISGTALSVAAASATAQGIVELATPAEVTTGTDSTRAVTAAGVKVELDKKAPLASPAFTGTPTGLTKSHVGLSNVDNTSDANKPVSTAQAAAIAAQRGLYVGINAQTGTTFTPALADQGKLVTLTNAGAITVTLPQNSDVALPINTQIDFQVRGAGMATFVAGTGATVDGTPSLVTRAQYSAITAIKISTNGWTLVGDLAS